jgi:hypothetical protein
MSAKKLPEDRMMGYVSPTILAPGGIVIVEVTT